MCKHCPICKSNDLLFIDPLESRKKIKSIINMTGMNSLPSELANLVSQLNLDGELSSEEEFFYKLHGRKIVCKDCGYTFYELDDQTNLESEPHYEVSKEEYFDYLKNHCTNQEFIDFVSKNSFPLKKYYIEALNQLLNEFEQINMQNDLLNDNFSDNNLVN